MKSVLEYLGDRVQGNSVCSASAVKACGSSLHHYCNIIEAPWLVNGGH
eukprot:COSAG01_NODE_29131_length_644_cov_2.856881_2_plen_47_part_01